MVLRKANGGNAGDQAALERLGASAPRHDPVGSRGEQACAGNQGWRAIDVEAAENVGPRTVAADRRAGAARAIGEALDAPYADLGAFGRLDGGIGQERAGPRLAIGFAAASTGRADVHGRGHGAASPHLSHSMRPARRAVEEAETGCVAARVPRTRRSHNVAASLLRTSGSKGALEVSMFLVSLWFRSFASEPAALLSELRNRDTSPMPHIALRAAPALSAS